MRVVSPLLLLASIQACSPGSGESRGVAKNVVFICVDTLRADYLGAYGAEPSSSPELDAFAEEAIVFENAHSHASWTLPSFASVLTSLYSSTHGCWNFESRLSDDFETLVEVFQDAGFDTHGIASHIYFNDKYGLQQGFDTFDDELANAKRGQEDWVGITSPIVTDKAVRWLEGREGSDAPFLLWVHYFDPHLPYADHGPGRPDPLAPSPLPEVERYKSEIRFTDGHVGRLLKALEEIGGAEDTVVVFLSDHGEGFGEHAPIKRHSYSLYAEEIRIPFMMRVPGMAPRRVGGFVRNVDVRPTLLGLFGLEARTPYTAGVDLRPAMLGEAHTSPALVSEIRLKDGFHKNALVDGRWKLVENVSQGGYELYDMRMDVGDGRDVAGEHPGVVEELSKELAGRIEIAERLAARFAGGGKVELTEEELRRIEELGYASDE